MTCKNRLVDRPILRWSAPCCRLAIVAVVALSASVPLAARADRSAAQGASGLFLEKAGRYAEAALYYHRALRGLDEVWIRFWYHGRAGNAHEVTRQIVAEYRDRLKRCMEKAGMGEAERQRIESLNEFWMGEYVDQELGGYKLAFGYRAEEAEKQGDFLFAEQLRQAAADYCRLVALPYHQKLAAKLDGSQQRAEAALHRQVAEEYERQAVEHEMLARGDALLARLPGLQSPPSPLDLRLLGEHYFGSYRVYHQRVLSPQGGRWLTGSTPEQVARILEQQGSKHADENARFASLVVLANLGERKAVRAALEDGSSRVRSAAAKKLAAIHWADGWAACHAHPDARIGETVRPLLEPAGAEVLSRTASIAELIEGLDSSSVETRSFCQSGLQRITGKAQMTAAQWQAWWNELGNARPGLTRTGPSGSPVLDATVDMGSWWHGGERSIHNQRNPLMQYSFPARIQWRGNLLVTRPGNYRFYVRTSGEKKSSFDSHDMLYFTDPCAQLTIGENPLLTDPADSVEDAKMHMRIDWSKRIRLEPGLHPLRLDVDIKNAGDGPWQHPSVRLYWSSEHFLREVIPADSLVSLD